MEPEFKDSPAWDRCSPCFSSIDGCRLAPRAWVQPQLLWAFFILELARFGTRLISACVACGSDPKEPRLSKPECKFNASMARIQCEMATFAEPRSIAMSVERPMPATWDISLCDHPRYRLAREMLSPMRWRLDEET